MTFVRDATRTLPLGLYCAGLLASLRHWLLLREAPNPELAAWILSARFPEHLIEALILGVLGSALAHRSRELLPLGFTAFVLAWGVAGIPRPDVTDGLPLAVGGGVLLALGVFALAGRPSRAWEGPVATGVALVLGLGAPLVAFGRQSVPRVVAYTPVEAFPAATPMTALELDVPTTGGPYALRGAGRLPREAGERLPAGVASAAVELEVRADGVPLAGARGVLRREAQADERLPLDRPPPALEAGAHLTFSVRARHGGEDLDPALLGVGFEGVAVVRVQEVPCVLATPSAPNLILVLVDGLGAEVTGRVRTPMLDGFARRGVVFERALAASGERSAALASLFGGELAEPPSPEPGAPVLAEAAAGAGLLTGFFGDGEHLLRPSRGAAGFHAVRLDLRDPDAIVGAAAEWVYGVAGARFLLVVVLPSDAPDERDLELSGGDAAVAGVRRVDRSLGVLLSHLEVLELEGSTLLAIAGTHGTADESRPPLHQERLHVPLVFVGPGITSGRRIEAAVQTRHLAATLTRWAGADFPRGRDLLAGPPAEGARFRGRDGTRGVRVGDWVLELTRDGVPALYQVSSDRDQRVDLAAERPEEVERLHTALEGRSGANTDAPGE